MKTTEILSDQIKQATNSDELFELRRKSSYNLLTGNITREEWDTLRKLISQVFDELPENN